ncbi:MAG: hypothetical protein JRE23_16495, partial [Deltaproteobacteria bacterium]|nr:hypothetical protein [Deltaproteobacteria bacterium]
MAEVIFIKDCGHRKAGDVLECGDAQAVQYIASKFAEQYTPPAPPETIVDASLQKPKRKTAKPRA